ncbi:MAG: hypothetical protein OXE86_10415 [Alphaproteobacteria bacterium]|nr:hypothetical protein [Alphaproteobacteria bacterium]
MDMTATALLGHLETGIALFNDRVLVVFKWFAIALLVSMLAIVDIAVFMHYVMNDALSWSEEIAKFVMVWLTFVVASGFHHMTAMASDDPKFTALAAYAAFKEKSGEVYVPSPEEKAQFVAAVQRLKDWYIEKFGDKWLKLLEESIAAAEMEIAEEDRKLLV